MCYAPFFNSAIVMLPCTLPALLVSLIHKVFVRLRGTLVVVFGEAKVPRK
jgi:hypothetical protein